MLFRKKEENRINEQLSEFGYAVREPYSENYRGRGFLCLIRGLLVFLGTYGTIGGLTGSFGLHFNPLTVGLCLFAISVIIAYTYYNKVTFYVGYVIMFLVFLFLYVSAYAYINSGFQAFLNEVYKAYSDFFALPSTRETTEYIADRTVTVPAAMLFTGAGFAILLNISISAYMDIFTTFLLTFLPLQVAFYIDIIPAVPYLFMLITVYITVAVLGKSGSFKLPYRYKKGQQYSYNPKAKKERYEYLSSGTGMLQLSLISAVLAAFIMLIAVIMFMGTFSTKFVSNRVKDKTDGYVKILAQSGFLSLFNRYEAKGGLSQGKLGGISSVSPDYETDIVVRMVPTFSGENSYMDEVYLKAYTGVSYSDNRFSPRRPGENGTDPSISDSYIPMGADYMDTGEEAYFKMFLLNKDADNTYDYRPYFSLYSGSGRNEAQKGISEEVSGYAQDEFDASGEVLRDSGRISDWANGYIEEGTHASYYELIYTPFTFRNAYETNPTVSEEYEKQVYENYMDIPEDLEDILVKTAEEAGLFEVNITTEKAKALKRYFEDEFTYSMLPGATPLGRDAIGYFLTDQKKGFCVHFAASGALILRAAGVPTRYIEGYVVTQNDVSEGSVTLEKSGDWVISSAEERDIAVTDVEIPDANAHAWIEIYIDGFGWVPFELTPPSEEDEIVNFGFAEFFAMLFSPTDRNAGADTTSGAVLNDGNFNGLTGRIRNSGMFKALGSVSFLLKPLLLTAFIIAFIVSAVYIAGYLRFRSRIRKYLNEGDYDNAILAEYLRFLSSYRDKGIIKDDHPTISDVHASVKSHILRYNEANEDRKKKYLYPDTGKLENLFETVSFAAFNEKKTGEDSYVFVSTELKHLMQPKKR
ncbi:MAG: transglutaminase-like domain-containing protein [Lachnospiraceae bacterium]|nr:transglutaminase-like domain-containing protein [Lachnospiraceae bacterium]